MNDYNIIIIIISILFIIIGIKTNSSINHVHIQTQYLAYRYNMHYEWVQFLNCNIVPFKHNLNVCVIFITSFWSTYLRRMCGIYTWKFAIMLESQTQWKYWRNNIYLQNELKITRSEMYLSYSFSVTPFQWIASPEF